MATAVATVVGAGIGAFSKNKSAKKLAKAQEESSRRFQAGVERAGGLVTEGLGRAQDLTRRATRQSLNLLGQTPERVTAPFQKGNVLAQGAISAGLEQQQAAILGQPTDFSAFAPQTIRAPRGINTQNLQLGLPQPPPAVDPNAANPNILDPNQQFTGRIAI